MGTVLLYIVILLIILAVFGTAAYAGFKASPWLPVLKRDIPRVLKIADIKTDDVVYDLGSGDGRIVIAVANNSDAQIIVGYEISFLLYLWSRLRLWFLGLRKRVEIRGVDFLSRDLGQASLVFCFLTPKAMKKLAPKFKKELRPGTRVISYTFSLPGWEPVVVDKPHAKAIPIFKYIVD